MSRRVALDVHVGSSVCADELLALARKDVCQLTSLPTSLLYWVQTTVTTKGQVTIPVQIRRKFNIGAGTILDFDEKAEQLVAAVVSAQMPIRDLIGSGKDMDAGRTSRQWLDQARGAVALPPKATKPR